MTTTYGDLAQYLPHPEGPAYGPPGVRGLEIGGGPHPRRLSFEQFDQIDWSERTQMQYTIGDARKLPYRDEEFDHVFASNVLEHFYIDETTAVLSEWKRVLRIGGLLELVVPDSMGILRDYFTNVNTWPHCQERLLGSLDYNGNEHYQAFTRTSFGEIIDKVPGLEMKSCNGCHADCGVHAVSIRTY